MQENLKMDDFIRYALSLNPDEFTIKGTDTAILLRPSIRIGIRVNGTRFEDVKSIIIENAEVRIYHGENLTENNLGFCTEFVLDNYKWEDILDDPKE